MGTAGVQSSSDHEAMQTQKQPSKPGLKINARMICAYRSYTYVPFKTLAEALAATEERDFTDLGHGGYQ